MSLATQIAVKAALSNNATLQAFLPADPQTPSDRAIFKGSHGKRMPVYPCITYRIPDEMPDQRFQPDIAAGGASSPISDERLEVEIWTEGGGAVAMDYLVQGVLQCFDGKALQLTGDAGQPAGRAHWCSLTGINRDMFAPSLGVYFSLLRFRIRCDFSAGL